MMATALSIITLIIISSFVGCTTAGYRHDGPTFTASHYTATLSPGANSGDHVLSLSTFTFPVYFYLLNQDNIFTMTPNGTLILTQSMNEASSLQHVHYTLTAGASNVIYPFHSSYVAIDIYLPNMAPSFSNSHFTVSISQNQLINTPFYSVIATTTDSFPIAYSIISGNSLDGIFAINGNTGQLLITKPLYGHEYDMYDLMIQASTRNVFNASVSVSISITRVLQFTQLNYTFNVPSYNNSTTNTTTIGLVNLINCYYSPLLPMIIYSVDNNDKLRVNSVTGEVYMIAELSDNAIINVTATYGNQSAQATVLVNVLPVSLEPQLSFDVNEYSISFNDDDNVVIDVNGGMEGRYRILNGNCVSCCVIIW
jgi:hypothetical protein